MEHEESQDYAQAHVVGLAERLSAWWNRPSRKELEAKLAKTTESLARCREQLMLVSTQHEALKMEIEVARRDYRAVRAESVARIVRGNRAEAVHEERREYENNRLRVFVNTVHRELTSVLNSIAQLNKDLAKGNSAAAGGMLEKVDQDAAGSG